MRLGRLAGNDLYAPGRRTAVPGAVPCRHTVTVDERRFREFAHPARLCGLRESQSRADCLRSKSDNDTAQGGPVDGWYGILHVSSRSAKTRRAVRSPAQADSGSAMTQMDRLTG